MVEGKRNHAPCRCWDWQDLPTLKRMVQLTVMEHTGIACILMVGLIGTLCFIVQVGTWNIRSMSVNFSHSGKINITSLIFFTYLCFHQICNIRS